MIDWEIWEEEKPMIIWKHPVNSEEEERNQRIPGKLKINLVLKKKMKEKIPGRLRNLIERGKSSTVSKDALKNASFLRKTSFVSGALILHKADNIKSALNSTENPEM